MNKKKIFFSITAGVIAAVALVVCVILLVQNYSAKSDGSITIEYVGLDENIIKEKNVSFIEGDKLEDLITNNFENVVFSNGMLMNIEDYETPENFSTFICVYVDDEMSQVGIASIEFTDGTVISLKITLLSNDW